MSFLDNFLNFWRNKWFGSLTAVVLAFLIVTVCSFTAEYFLKKNFLKVSTKHIKGGGLQVTGDLNIVYKTVTPDQLEAIKSRNIFNAENLGKKEKIEEDNGSDEISESSLPLRLLGVISGGQNKNGIAIFENQKTKTINSFMTNDLVLKSPRVTLKEIYPDKVIVENNLVLEFIKVFRKPVYRNRRIKKSRPIAVSSRRGLKGGYAYAEDGLEVNESDVKVTRLYWDNMLKRDLPRVLQDAKASPNIVDGQLKGFKLNRIRANSIYEKVGLKDGDVIEEINGVQLNDTGRALKLLNRLRSAGEDVSIKYNRGGSSTDLNLSVGR